MGIIAAADTEQCLWQSTFNRVTATTADLLLTKSEAAEFYAGLAGRRTGEETANPPFAKAWRAVGSWLYGLASVQRYGHRATCIRDGMTWLLNNLDSYTGSVSKHHLASFLRDYDDDVLTAFIPVTVGNPPTVAELLADGLIVQTSDGYRMPTTIREVLQKHFRGSGGEEAEMLLRALRALMETKGLTDALDVAAEASTWEGVGLFLDEYWVDVLTKEPSLLKRDYPELYQRLLARFGDANLAGRILSTFINENPDAWPASPVPYEENLTVQRLLNSLRRAPHPASARTLTTSLVFLNYLRFARYHDQAAEHARRLRDEMIASYDHYRLNPLLRAHLSLTIGTSLLQDLDFVGASLAFAESYQIAEEQQNAYIAAEASSQIALVAAFDGDFPEVDRWVNRAHTWAQESNWGHRIILRGALLARSFSELHQLRLKAAQQTLAELDSPHRGLFWEFELFIRAVVGVLINDVEVPVREATQALADETFALSKAGAALLETVPDLARLRAGLPVELHSKPNPNQALYYLQRQDMDGLISLLQRLPQPLTFGVHARLGECLASYLRLDPDSTTEEYAELLLENGGERFSLLEIMLLSFLPRCRRLACHMELDPEDEALILKAREEWETLYDQAPELTPREAEILDLLRRGHNRADIAKLTYRSENTILAQLSSLYRKLGVNNRAQALESARLLGL